MTVQGRKRPSYTAKLKSAPGKLQGEYICLATSWQDLRDKGLVGSVYTPVTCQVFVNRLYVIWQFQVKGQTFYQAFHRTQSLSRLLR